MIIVLQEVGWEKLVLLKDFSLITPTLEAELIFKAIETVISPSVIRETLSETDSGEERCLRRASLTRKLPSGLVVCLVIAMNLWSSDAMGDVLKNLVNGLSRQWTRLGQYWKVPSSSSISEARQRLGCWAMSRLFHSYSQTISDSADSRGIFRRTTSNGSRRYGVGCPR